MDTKEKTCTSMTPEVGLKPQAQSHTWQCSPILVMKCGTVTSPTRIGKKAKCLLVQKSTLKT